MSTARALGSASLAVLVIAGCGGGGGGGGGGGSNPTGNAILRGLLTFLADGGGASGNSTVLGGAGGSFSGQTFGNLNVGVNPAPLAPILPTPLGAVTPVVSWTDVQTISSGSAAITGSITASTTGSTATLNVTTGDLFIFGTLTGGNIGPIDTSLEINVPAGTVWIQGTIRTGRVDGVDSGDSGGGVRINALRIVFSGTIDTRGENGSAGSGGNGGAAVFTTEAPGATTQIYRGGSLNLSGGNATGTDPVGGQGGFFSTAGLGGASANGSVHVEGTTIISDGGSATGTGLAQAGWGGGMSLQADGGAFFNGSFSARGGTASSSDGIAGGGTGGSVIHNTLASGFAGPCALFGTIDLSGGAASCGAPGFAQGGDGGTVSTYGLGDFNFGAGVYSLRGGDSSGSGGRGGDIAFSSLGIGDLHFDAEADVSSGAGPGEQSAPSAGLIGFFTRLGDITLAGEFDLNGASGSSPVDPTVGPSAGGLMFVRAGEGQIAHAGSITVIGAIRANGGSDSDAADDTFGADGGLIFFQCDNGTGSIHLEATCSIQVNGGNGGGPGPDTDGGWGGLLSMQTSGGVIADGTVGGNVSLRGSIAATGGAGGVSFGGFGGEIAVNTDDSSLTIAAGDGRAGDITLHAGALIDVSGGSGGFGGDALNDGVNTVTFPVAVTFDADGDDSDSAENGIVRNLGTIVARGAPIGGFGGDILFDGLDASLNVGPLPGFLDLFGAAVGDFLSQ